MTYLDDLAAADPVREETPYEQGRAAALIADITAGLVTAPPPPPAPSRRPWLVGGIAVAAAATLAGVLVIPPVLRHDAEVSPARPVPTTASEGATVRPVTPTASTQYWKTVHTGLSNVSMAEGNRSVYHVPFTSTSYDPVDPARRAYSVDEYGVGQLVGGEPVAQPPEPGRRVLARQSGNPTTAPGYPGNWATPMPSWVAGLPRDPEALKKRLYSDASAQATPSPGEAAGLAVAALSSGMLPADVRDSLVRVLVTIPGVTVTQARQTVAGQPGLALTIERAGPVPIRGLMVLADEGGAVLTRHEVLTQAYNGLAAGTVMREYRMVSRELVDSVPQELLDATQRPCSEVAPTGQAGPSHCYLAPIGGDPSATREQASRSFPSPPGPSARGTWSPGSRPSG